MRFFFLPGPLAFEKKKMINLLILCELQSADKIIIIFFNLGSPPSKPYKRTNSWATFTVSKFYLQTIKTILSIYLIGESLVLKFFVFHFFSFGVFFFFCKIKRGQTHKEHVSIVIQEGKLETIQHLW